MEPSQERASEPAGIFDDITLPQAILLLSLDDATGQTEAGYYQPAFAGAALAELLLRGAIELNDEEVVPLRHTQRLSAFLSLCDDAIGSATRKHSLDHWIRDLGNQKEVVATLADELCHLGALSKEKTRIFGVFTRTIWPEASPALENRLKHDLRTAMSQPGPGTDVTLLLTLALADAVDVLKFNFEADMLSVCASHISAIAEGGVLGSADLQAVLATVKTAIDGAHSSADSAVDTIIQ